MNRAGKIAVCLAVGLALNISLRADDAVLTGNPYALIVARNIFGLNPPPPPTQEQPSDPPAKITPNGIMSIFGNLQVLFKVTGTAKPGQPAKDQSYILSVGQRQDDIEVTRIDEKNNLVTFNNRGVVQELPLANAPALTTAAPPSAPGLNPAMPAVIPNINNGGSDPGGNRFGRSGGGFGGNVNPTTDLRNVPTRNNALIQRPQSTLTPEAQIVNTELSRVLTQDQVTKGEMPPLPPTELTPDDATGIGGGPLVSPASGASE